MPSMIWVKKMARVCSVAFDLISDEKFAVASGQNSKYLSTVSVEPGCQVSSSNLHIRCYSSLDMCEIFKAGVELTLSAKVWTTS